jgi:FkbM family methyltransferase
VLEHDLPRLILKGDPLIFDVGANKGQTIELLRRAFRNPRIYSFEPARELAEGLRKKYSEVPVVVEQMALGEKEEVRSFIHYENNELSSFLTLNQDVENPFRETKVSCRESITIDTVESYAKRNNIRKIDLLKIDTQGFDFEVLRGAEDMLDGESIRAILVELNFVPLYATQCRPGQIVDWLGEHGYSLVGLYEEVRSNMVLSWATGLFLTRIPQSE